ncbi:MAG: Murein hydrolase activator EnvC precursor [Elusimicrobia bacterium ADurb.Bin231]|nr:MAG: Murein hydrolase activator EnvC precursor [Elusimicrobia bacterium ADurb.Bin231]
MLWKNRSGRDDLYLITLKKACLAGLRFVLLFCVVASYIYAAQTTDFKTKIDKNKQQLSKVKSQIQSKQKSVAVKKNEEVSLKHQLESITKKLEKTKKEISVLHADMKRRNESANLLKNKLEKTTIESVYWKEVLGNEVRYTYKHRMGMSGQDMILLTSSSAEAAKKKKFIQAITKQKTFVYAQTLKKIDEYLSLKKVLDKELRDIGELERKKRTAENKYYSETRQKKKLLSSVSKQRLFHEQELQKLKDSEKLLSELLKEYEKKAKEQAKKNVLPAVSKPAAASSPAKMLNWPLEGNSVNLKKGISDKFGRQKHSELNTWIINNGIRITAPAGSNVIASMDGVIVYAGEFKSYGNMVIVDHGKGLYTIYGNLESINVKNGQKIVVGGLLGKVGLPQSSQKASLYFEVRKDGAPQNPLVWLK